MSRGDPGPLLPTVPRPASPGIGVVGLGTGEEAVALAVCAAIASSTIVGPVVVAVVAGERAEPELASLRVRLVDGDLIVMTVRSAVPGARVLDDGIAIVSGTEAAEAMTACCGPGRDGCGTDADPAAAPAPAGPAPELAPVPAGVFTMGTEDPGGYPADGEGPAHQVELDGFEMGVYAVTNDEFGRFVDATGYRSTAEQFGDSFVFGGLLPDDFPPTRGVAAAPWWRQVEGADWRHPEGPQSDLEGRGDHPVAHVSWFDAVAFCAWSGTRLPTEAEWERAARGGRAGHHFPWGDDLEPGGEHRMNVFQGTFPSDDTGADGWVGTCPVGSFPPNGFGLHETTGNVWEWCGDWFDAGYYAVAPRRAPPGPTIGEARVTRGGSYLCHASYCRRYRVDARSAGTPDSTTGNTGFRVAR